MNNLAGLAPYVPKNLAVEMLGVDSMPELIVNGDFSAWNGDPTGWTVNGESTPNREISEVGTGEGHGGAGTGSCNLYTDDGTQIFVWQEITLVVGRKYRGSIKVNKVTLGGIDVYDRLNAQFDTLVISSTGTFIWTFVATNASCGISIRRKNALTGNDVTFDNPSMQFADLTQQVRDRPIRLFSICCPNPRAYSGEVSLYDGFSVSDSLKFSVAVPAYRSRARVFIQPMIFSKGCFIKLTIGTFPTVQYLVG